MVVDLCTFICCYSGADVDSPSSKNITCLMGAANHGNLDLCQLLVALGADLFAEDVDGDNALKWAEHNNKHEVATYLKEQMAKKKAAP